MTKSERRRGLVTEKSGEGRKGKRLNNVLSLRISDDARQVLERTARKRRRTLSRLLRELIDEWASEAKSDGPTGVSLRRGI